MRTAADKVDVASDRRRRENVPRHILCSLLLCCCYINLHSLFPLVANVRNLFSAGVGSGVSE